MKKLLLGAAVSLVAIAPADAQASLRSTYLHHYEAVQKKFGARAPGRNIVRYGLPNGHRAPRARIRRSLAVLDRMLHPPVVRTTVSTPTGSTSGSAAGAPATASSAPAASGGLPSCTWQPESGGDWHAVNPSSGAGGYYQITPSTWQAYGGTGSPQDASPAEQTAVAARVYAGQGAGAWSNC